jgi:hypothetical protein
VRCSQNQIKKSAVKTSENTVVNRELRIRSTQKQLSFEVVFIITETMKTLMMAGTTETI